MFSLTDWSETASGRRLGGNDRQLKRKRPDTTPAISYTLLRTTAKTETRIPETPNLACHQCWGQACLLYTSCGGLVQGRDGNFYGTTYQGGITNASAFYGWGTVFQVATNGTLTTLFSFNGTNGGNPYASLVLGSDGDFYGTTSTGGKYGKGTIFRLSIPMPPMFQSINKTNGAIAFTWSAVAGQSYQLQYKTNLIQANWLGLGGSMIATNSPMSSTDSTPTNSQRLYRVVLQ